MQALLVCLLNFLFASAMHATVVARRREIQNHGWFCYSQYVCSCGYGLFWSFHKMGHSIRYYGMTSHVLGIIFWDRISNRYKHNAVITSITMPFSHENWGDNTES